MFLDEFITSTFLLNYLYFSIATLTAIFFGTLLLRSNQRHFLNEAAEAALLEHRDAQRQVKQKTKLREKYLEEGKKKKKKNHEEEKKKAKEKNKSNLPPGQVQVSKWIVLDLGRPSPDIFDYKFGEKWKLDLFYVHSNKISDLLKQPQKSIPNATFDSTTIKKWMGEYGELRLYKMDWHCVTGWTARNVTLLGLPFEFVLSKLLPLSSSSSSDDGGDETMKWEWMVQVSADGYAAPVYRGDIFNKDEGETGAFLCVGMIDPNNNTGNDKVIIPLPEERGTIRFVFPNLYGWKSVKCLREVHFLPRYVDGLWEKLGTHPRGRWEYNERWKEEEEEANLGRWNTMVWNMAKKAIGFYRVCFGERVYEIVMIGGGNILAAWLRFAGFFAAQKPCHEEKT